MKPSAILALALVVGGCGPNPDPEPTPAAEPSVRPAARPAIDVSGPSRAYAMDTLHLGQVDRSGRLSSKAWAAFGYDLDGRQTTMTEGASCKGEVRRVDGKGGVDNSFGGDLIALLLSLRFDLESATSGDMPRGTWTWVLVLDDVGGDDDARAAGHLYLGVGHAGSPSFTAADHWPATKVADFPDGYVAAGTWVSGAPRAIDLPMRLGGHPLALSLKEAFVTLRLADGAGIVAGALPRESFEPEYVALMHGIQSCLKGPPYDEVFRSHVRSALDLRLGSADPSAPCDAVSFGVGFHAAPTGSVLPSAAPLELPKGVVGWCTGNFFTQLAPGSYVSPLDAGTD